MMTDQLNIKRAKSVREIAVLLAVAIYPLGSFIHVYSSELSGTNMLVVILLPFALLAFTNAILKRTMSYGALAFSLLIVLSGICVLIDPAEENARLFRGSLVGAVGAYGAVWVCENRPGLVPACVTTAVLLTMGIAALQATYLIFGIGLSPYSDDMANPAAGLVVGIPSAFGNPNDFSVFLLLVLTSCLWRSGGLAAAIRVACIVGIVLSGSKLAFLLGMLGFFFGTVKRFLFVFLPAIMIGGFVVTTWWGLLEIYSIQRIILEGELIRDGAIPTGGSLDVRFSSASHFFQNFHEFMVGSFSAAHPYPQFLGASFDASLISVNPHSVLIELAALFGAFGLLVFLLLSVSTVGRLRASGYSTYKLWFSFLSIVGAAFIPSSILFNGWFFGVAALVVSWALVDSKSDSKIGRTSVCC